jgi:hypothetical protein
MRRRDLLLLGTAAIAAPTVARPQTSGGIQGINCALAGN